MATIDELMAAMNGHKLTDVDGNLSHSVEETIDSDSAADQAEVEAETPEEDFIEAEKPNDQEDDTLSDPEEEDKLIDDESEQRIPKKRFDKVYGELKAKERELETLRANSPQRVAEPVERQITGDKASVLETELLYDKFPQFDPDAESYSKVLDQMGAEIYAANPGISKLEAARRALRRASELTKQVDVVKGESRVLKKQIADSGMVSRASRSTNNSEIDLDKMSDKDLKAYLEATGNW